MDYAREALRLHREWKGKIEVVATVPAGNKEELSVAYTPGVAQPCLEIQKDPSQSYELTRRHNLVAVITDGTAVLGLGDIGPEAGMPVMEGKCVLFKTFGGIDAFPLCVRTKDVDEFVQTVYNISGFTNALRVVGKKKEDVKVVFSGAGSAAISITKLLLSAGFRHITLCDKFGAVCKGDPQLNEAQAAIAEVTNLERRTGTLAEMMVGADVFIGVSAPKVVTPEMVGTMAKDAVVFACANPTPEIFPEEAKAGGAAVVSTGRSDYPNQINNVLAFPGIFRGAFDVRASDINEEMKMAAARALAGLIGEEELSEENIIPKPFDPRVVPAVAQAVAQAARETGVARL